jgi:hypothetical protein
MVRRRAILGASLALAVCASSCGGSSNTPAAPSPRVAAVSVASLTATTERQENGNLSYLADFQVRESAGVGITIASIESTLTGAAAGTSTIAGSQLPSARVPASGSVGYHMRATSNSVVQAQQLTLRVVYNDDNNNPGTATATSGITPAPAIPTPPPCVSPGAPSGLSTSISGSTVTFSWSAPSSGGTPVDYLLGIGTSPGSSNVDTKTVSGTSFTWTNVSTGSYHARVQARNSCGTGSASNEVTFRV